MQDWPVSIITPKNWWALAGPSLGAMVAWFWMSRRERKTSRPEVSAATQLRQAQDELTRLFGRYQLLESSHQSLQSDLSQERSVLMSIHAELARERSLRMNLELALETVRQERSKTTLQPTPIPVPQRGPEAPIQGTERPNDRPSAAVQSSDIKELLRPINSELEAVRKELAERRENSDQTLGRLMQQIENLKQSPSGSAYLASSEKAPPISKPVELSQPPKTVVPTSKAERELNNFFRRIQIDPAGAKSATPGNDGPETECINGPDE